MIWIAGSWVVVTAFWPIWWSTGESNALPAQTLKICGERFLVIAALTLPFDLRDRKWDPVNMRTWAQMLGPRATRWLAMGMVFLAAAHRLSILQSQEYMALLGILAMGPAVLMAKENRSEQYYGLLDALFVLIG